MRSAADRGHRTDALVARRLRDLRAMDPERHASGAVVVGRVREHHPLGCPRARCQVCQLDHGGPGRSNRRGEAEKRAWRRDALADT